MRSGLREVQILYEFGYSLNRDDRPLASFAKE